jgi:hypothetical protein
MTMTDKPIVLETSSSNAEVDRAISLLRRFLTSVACAEALAWLDVEIQRQRDEIDEHRLGIAFGLARRKVGSRAITLSPEALTAASNFRPGWQPQHWAADEAARTALLLASFAGDDDAFANRLNRLCATADTAEQISFLKGLAILPGGSALYQRAREGVRSSITPIFAAVACHNPYPRDHFDSAVWNQMVVKCVFVGESIGTIVGLHERRNPELIRMLHDFSAERQAAGRSMPDEIFDFISC